MAFLFIYIFLRLLKRTSIISLYRFFQAEAGGTFACLSSSDESKHSSFWSVLEVLL